MSRTSLARNPAGLALGRRGPAVALLALGLAACGGVPQIMDGSPHAGSIQPTVAVPQTASTDYSRSGAAGADDTLNIDQSSAAPEVAAVGAEMTTAGASSEEGLSGAAPSRLTERGFFGIAEPLRRAEQPTAAPQQPRQPTEAELRERARRDALASVVGQFDSPAQVTRAAPTTQRIPQNGPRIADVPDRPSDAPTPEELAAMRAQLEASRDRGQAAGQPQPAPETEPLPTAPEASSDPVDDEPDTSAPDTETADADTPDVEAPTEDPAAMAGAVAMPVENDDTVSSAPELSTEQTTDQAPAAPAPAPAPATPSVITIPFTAGAATLSADSRRMVTDLGSDTTLSGASIRVVGFATEADGGSDTARSRASAVADALNGALASNGITGVRVQVDTAIAPDDAEPMQASRVDIRISG